MTDVVERAASLVTDAADAGVVVPVWLAATATLLLQGRRRAPLVWSCVMVGTWSTMLALKLLGYMLADLPAGAVFARIGFVTSSGHAASATAAYGGLIWLAGGLRGAAWLGAAAVALVVALTRLVLGAHSVIEVVVGAAVGLAGVGVLLATTGGHVPPRRRAALLGVVGLTVLCFHGTHVNLEATLQALAARAVDAPALPEPR